MYIYIYMQTWEKKRNETDLIEGLIAPAHNNILLRSIDTIFTKYDEEKGRVTKVWKENIIYRLFASSMMIVLKTNNRWSEIYSNHYINVKHMEMLKDDVILVRLYRVILQIEINLKEIYRDW